MNTDKIKTGTTSTRVLAANAEEYPEQELTARILAGAFAVHNALGAGFLERVYANALALELRREGLTCIQEAPLKVKYHGIVVGDYVADMVVADRVLIEMKACAVLDQNHSAQIMNYLRASEMKVGLLLNFGRPKLEYRRFVC
jgi:GxxExxY protein